MSQPDTGIDFLVKAELKLETLLNCNCQDFNC